MQAGDLEDPQLLLPSQWHHDNVKETSYQQHPEMLQCIVGTDREINKENSLLSHWSDFDKAIALCDN